MSASSRSALPTQYCSHCTVTALLAFCKCPGYLRHIFTAQLGFLPVVVWNGSDCKVTTVHFSLLTLG